MADNSQLNGTSVNGGDVIRSVQKGGATGPKTQVVTLDLGGGGASGNIREVRRFAQMLADARRPTKAQKKRRKQEIQREVLELLPDLPQAEEVAPIIAQKVYAQEARIADITRRAMPSQVLQPVVVPFDAQAEIARMVEEWARNEAIRRELEDEEDIEFLLMSL